MCDSAPTDYYTLVSQCFLKFQRTSLLTDNPCAVVSKRWSYATVVMMVRSIVTTSGSQSNTSLLSEIQVSPQILDY